MSDQIRLKNGTELTRAFSRERGFALYVEHAGGCDDLLWAFGREFGPEVIVAAETFGEAWEAAVNALPTIPETDVPEAYGFTNEADLEAAYNAAREGIGDFPRLVEGYEHQSKPGIGIVDIGYHAWLKPLTKRLLKEWQIKLEITADF